MSKRGHTLVPPIRLRVPSLFRKQHLIGARPGSLSVSASAPKPKIRVIHYDRDVVVDNALDHPSDLANIDATAGVTWIDVQGLGDEETLRNIADQFSIHPLALADMVNVPQRPKVVAYDDKLLWVTRMVRIDTEGVIDREQLSLIHSEKLLITFQERPGDVLDSVRKRIHEGLGQIRLSNADYLVYALLDTVVDGYYPVVDQTNGAMELLEARVMSNPNPEQLAAINQTKLLSTTIRRAMFAQMLALRDYLDDPTTHVGEEQLPYFRDILDHAHQLTDVMENQRDLLAGLLNTYLSMVSYRANEVMKVLTIMASIFIPLTFIAGVYGMNFQHMPELGYRWAYPLAIAVMAVVALGMVGYFVRKGWIGASGTGLRSSAELADSGLAERPVPGEHGSRRKPRSGEGSC